ncbi:MAG: hypothetical protein ABW222_09570 [Actinomycetota bacterium]
MTFVRIGAVRSMDVPLVGIEPEAGHLDQLGAQEVAPLELHPGAARYYDEILR